MEVRALAVTESRTRMFFEGLDAAMEDGEQRARLGFPNHGYPFYARQLWVDDRVLAREITLPRLTVRVDNHLPPRSGGVRESSVAVSTWRRVISATDVLMACWVIPAETEQLGLFMKALEALMDPQLGHDGFAVVMESLVFDRDLLMP